MIESIPADEAQRAGKGSRFTVVLPQVPAMHAAESPLQGMDVTRKDRITSWTLPAA